MKRVILTLAMVGVWCVAVLPVHAAGDDARVLILNGLDPYLPAYMAIDNAMRTSLAKESTKRIVLYSEPLDAQRFAVGPRESQLVASLAKKYDGLQIDVVVTVMKPALDFYKKHGAALWPGARLVFHGLPDPAEETVAVPDHATGLVNRDDFAGTVALAQRLQPNARRILVINGVSPLDLELERRARQVVPAVAGTATVEFLSGAVLAELVARLAKEPADTIVLYLTQFRDREDRPYLPRQVLQAISAVSTAPVYGLFETYVGSGVAAGSMEFYDDRGQMVGQLVRDALAGQAPAAGRAVLSVPSRCIADTRALRRWALDEARLPEGCDIRFVERSLWREYRWQILGALAVLLLQTALIGGLLIERRRRHLAELETRRRLLEVAHLNRTATAGVMSASVAHELNQPLGAILLYTETLDILLQADPVDRRKIGEIVANIRRDDRRAEKIIKDLSAFLRKKQDIEAQPLDLNEVVQGALHILGPEAARKDVALKAYQAAGLLPVRADPVHLQQVILNLAINGMDAMQDMTGPRSIALQTARTGSAEVTVSVSDDGPGIPEEKLNRIFETFYTTKQHGSGLGLSIARTIVGIYGGKIWAENKADGGAMFCFTLPLVQAQTASTGQHSTP